MPQALGSVERLVDPRSAVKLDSPIARILPSSRSRWKASRDCSSGVLVVLMLIIEVDPFDPEALQGSVARFGDHVGV